MRLRRPRLLLAALFVQSSVVGCATIGHRRPSPAVSPSYRAPLKIAILPFNNVSVDLDAPAVIRDLVRINLLRKGYALADLSETDSTLRRKFSIDDGGQLPGVTPRQLGDALAVDGLLYGTVERFKLVPAGAYNERTAGVRLRLLRPQDGAVLFESAAEASDKWIEVTGREMLMAGAQAAAEKVFAKVLGHPLRPIAAAAVNKTLRPLPPTAAGMPDFGGRTRDEIGLDERCVLLVSLDPEYGVWAGTEVDPFAESPVCYKPTGVQNIDDFFDSVSVFTAKVRLAATIAYWRKRGLAKASNGHPVERAAARAGPLLAQALQEVPLLIEQGAAIVKSAPSQFAGKDLLRLPKVVVALSRALQNLLPAVAQGRAAMRDIQEKPGVEATLAAAPAAAPAAPARPSASSAPAEQAPRRPLGSKALRILRAAARDKKSPAHRLQAVEALGSLGRPAVAPLLRRALQDSDGSVRVAAAEQLARLSDPAGVLALRAMARSGGGDAEHRAAAILALGRLKARDAEDELRRARAGSSGPVRRAASTALAGLGDRKEFERLLEALLGADHGARLSAVRALQDIGSEDALSHLTAAAGDDEANVRAAAIGALGATGSEAAAPAVEAALDDESLLVRAKAVEAFGKLPASSTEGLLEKAAADKDSIFLRLLAQEAWARHGKKADLSLARTALSSDAVAVRRLAVRVLFAMPGEEAAGLVASALDDPAPTVRVAAAGACLMRLTRPGAYLPPK